MMGLLLCAVYALSLSKGAPRAMIYTANRNPVIERIVTTASPIGIATIADVCDAGDSMEERPLFPATRSRFRGVPHPQGWLYSYWMSRSDCV